jgi:hypothetical protein
MTIPTPQQLQQLGLMPRTLRERFRDRSSLALIGLGVVAVALSALTLTSVGLFIGLGSAGLFLLGGLIYPTRSRWKAAIGGTAWAAFCLAILLAVLLGD